MEHNNTNYIFFGWNVHIFGNEQTGQQLEQVRYTDLILLTTNHALHQEHIKRLYNYIHITTFPIIYLKYCF